MVGMETESWGIVEAPPASSGVSDVTDQDELC